MSRLKSILGLAAVLVIAGVLIIKIVQPAQALPINDPDFIAIQTTVRTYADIKDEALYTLDDSRLNEVLANDPRGGLVDPIYVKSVRYMTGKPDLKIEDIGFLDVNRARYAFDRKVKQVYDDAVATGEVEVPTPPPYDPSDNPTSIDIQGTDKDPKAQPIRPDPRIVPEIRAMENATGLVAALPVPPTVKKKLPTGFNILSISVEGDLAYAKVDWDYGLCEDILVKKDGNWYLIGHKIIEWHAG